MMGFGEPKKPEQPTTVRDMKKKFEQSFGSAENLSSEQLALWQKLNRLGSRNIGEITPDNTSDIDASVVLSNSEIAELNDEINQLLSNIGEQRMSITEEALSERRALMIKKLAEIGKSGNVELVNGIKHGEFILKGSINGHEIYIEEFQKAIIDGKEVDQETSSKLWDKYVLIAYRPEDNERFGKRIEHTESDARKVLEDKLAQQAENKHQEIIRDLLG